MLILLSEPIFLTRLNYVEKNLNTLISRNYHFDHMLISIISLICVINCEKLENALTFEIINLES